MGMCMAMIDLFIEKVSASLLEAGGSGWGTQGGSDHQWVDEVKEQKTPDSFFI